MKNILNLSPSGFRNLCLGIALWLLLGACGPSIPPSPHQWKEFAKTDGHANEIPAVWLATPEGKFAHAIKIPNPVSVDSGYKKTMSPREYFDHLCKTESGNFIFKTVENVEGLAMLRVVNGNTVEQQEDLWWQEAPGLQGKYPRDYSPKMTVSGFVNPPWQTYTYVELQTSDRRKFLHISEKLDRNTEDSERIDYAKVDVVDRPSSKYAVTWRGIKREKDRENRISGYEWIILDLETNEVLAVLRNFSQTGNVSNRKNGIYWQIAMQCPVLSKVNGTDLFTYEETRWPPRILQPKDKPQVLKNIDKQQGATK